MYLPLVELLCREGEVFRDNGFDQPGAVGLRLQLLQGSVGLADLWPDRGDFCPLSWLDRPCIIIWKLSQALQQSSSCPSSSPVEGEKS